MHVSTPLGYPFFKKPPCHVFAGLHPTGLLLRHSLARSAGRYSPQQEFLRVPSSWFLGWSCYPLDTKGAYKTMLIWVCLKIGYPSFQWIQTSFFLLKWLFGGYTGYTPLKETPIARLFVCRLHDQWHLQPWLHPGLQTGLFLVRSSSQAKGPRVPGLVSDPTHRCWSFKQSFNVFRDVSILGSRSTFQSFVIISAYFCWLSAHFGGLKNQHETTNFFWSPRSCLIPGTRIQAFSWWLKRMKQRMLGSKIVQTWGISPWTFTILSPS